MVVLLVVAVVCLAGVSLTGGFTKTPSLKIKGSTTIQPLMDVFAEVYEKRSGVRIDIMGGGSGVGISSVLNGRADIGMSSRELKASEQGKGLERTVIGIDVIAIIIHPGLADYVEDLNGDDLRNIFSGTVNNWKNLVEGGPDLRILPVIREAGSGTRDFFEEVSGPVPDDARYPSVTSNGAMIITVNQTRGAIGYISLGSITPECETVKFGGMEATDEGYRISRPLLLFTKGSPVGDAREFIEWILGDGQAVVERMGFARIS
jgi:phosphate transport system substrate-binding protein